MKKFPVFSDFLWIILICVIAVLSFYLYFFGRYDAFPWEKRVAKNIELAAYDGEENYKSSNHDYCIPDPKLQVCSEEYALPGEPCFVQRCRWGHVTELDLTGGYHYSGHLQELPPEIKTLTGLETLNLSGSELTGLPPEIGELRNLETLILSGNQLTSLPPEIGKFRNLTVLDLRGNQLTSLPLEIGQLRKLTSLHLEQNPLSGPLPKFFTSLPLEYFGIAEYQCIPVDKDFQEWIRGILSRNPNPFSQDDLCSLVEEDQSAMLALYKASGHPVDWSIQTLPCTWSGVNCDLAGHVVELHLRMEKSQDGTFITNLTALPPEIGDLAYLRTLFLSSNNLTELPPEIGQLQSLSYLELSGNQLASLPPEIGQLTNLRTLLLNENQLTELPPEIGRLKKLELLNVDFNPLSGPLPLFLTQIPDMYFAFYNTDLCVPDDKRILDWLQQQIPNSPKGYIYQDWELVLVDPDAMMQTLIKNQSCK